MKGDSSKRLLVSCIEISRFRKLILRDFCYYLLRFVQKRKSWHEYVASIGQSFTTEAVGQHNAHHPEIQILSDTEATALWYLADNMWILNHNFKTHGTALYWDRYLKVDGRWLIKDTNYERIYEINDALEERPKFSSHYLGVHGTKPQT